MRPARDLGAGLSRAATGPATARGADLVADVAPEDLFSRRFCSRDGAAMHLRDRDAGHRRWACPVCGDSHR